MCSGEVFSFNFISMNVLTALTMLASFSLFATGSGSKFRLIQPKFSECFCPRVNLVFECNVTGRGSTVYEGQFLSHCPTNELILLHSRFENGMNISSCNDGDNIIVAQSIGIVNDTYISLLHVRLTVNSNFGTDISCAYDDGTKSVEVGRYTIGNTTSITPLPPPEDISWKSVFPNMLFFQWSHVPSNCSSVVKYNIQQLNCGHCPSTTVAPNVMCDDVLESALSMCRFSVQSVLCENITGEWSNQIFTTKSDNTAVGTAVTVIVGPTAVTFTSIILLVGIVICIALGIKRKNRLPQQQSIIPEDRTIQETKDFSDRPKPKFHCVPTTDSGIHGYSLCESDYDNVTVSNNNYSHLDYNPCLDLVNKGEIGDDDKCKRSEEMRGRGCVRDEDEFLDLENVLVKLRGKVKGHWYHFGITIGVPKDMLSQLYGYADDDCLIEILDYWIKNHPDQPTWKELADAMEDLGDYELANSILKVYNQHDEDSKHYPTTKFHEYINEPKFI